MVFHLTSAWQSGYEKRIFREEWTKFAADLRKTADCDNIQLRAQILTDGDVDLRKVQKLHAYSCSGGGRVSEDVDGDRPSYAAERVALVVGGTRGSDAEAEVADDEAAWEASGLGDMACFSELD